MQTSKIRLSLGIKLLLVFLTIGLLPLIATGAVNIVLTSDTLRDRVIDDEQASLQRKASEIERFLGTTTDDIRLLTQSVTVQAMVQAIADRDTMGLQTTRQDVATDFQNFVLRRSINEQPVYARIRFLDSDGFEFVRVDYIDGQAVSVTNLNFRSDEDYFTQARDLPEGESYVSAINLFDEYGQIQRPLNPVLQYSTPVYVDDTFVGVLVTDIQAQEFLDLVQADLPPETTAFLVDSDGYYLSHPDDSRLFGRDLETGIQLQSVQPELVTALSTLRADTAELEDEIAVYQPIYPPGQQDRYWVLFSLRPLSAVLSPVRQQQNTLVFALMLVGAVVTGIALYFARNISSPITQLTRAAGLITSGSLDQHVEIERQDEIGQLGVAFNTMTDNLARTIGELEDLSATLEQRVNDRTRDLRIASDVSRQITTELNIDKLLQQVVALTTLSFDFYASFIFRLDEDTRTLVRFAGIDSSGTVLTTASMENIPLDTEPSVVALAARSREAVIVNDVSESTVHQSQNLLPETRAELAIPLLLGGELLGVFDVQSRLPERFTEDELRVLTSLAEQITIAIRNAQLFAEAEASREAAEQASQVKSQFLANMSHELRTPLNAILNFTGFVADGLLGPVNDNQVDSLNKVITSSQHLLSLINDILDLTKIEVGMMDLFIQDVDFNAALEVMLSTAKGLVKDKPIDVLTDIEPDLPVIMGDKRRIRQILLNLISNAVKFTPEGSIAISAHHRDAAIQVSVKDTGIGISLEQEPLVFETFQQAKHELQETPGTGLGMPITKAFVEAHGGQIWFESTVGVGTTFYVTLPLRAPTIGQEMAVPLADGQT